MSPRLSRTDLHFLQAFMSIGPAFNQRLRDHREAVDIILDVTSIKRSFLQVRTVRRSMTHTTCCFVTY
jgi:hypothetical protein